VSKITKVKAIKIRNDGDKYTIDLMDYGNHLIKRFNCESYLDVFKHFDCEQDNVINDLTTGYVEEKKQ